MIGRGYPADRIATVPLGINVSRFDVTDADTRREAKRRLLGLEDPDRTFVIVDTARVDGQKRPHLVPKTIRLLVDALDRVPPAQRDFDRVLAIMIGDGPLRTATEELVEGLNVTKEVRLLGTIMEPAGYLQAGDVYFLPTFNEAMSLAVAEGMARGLPVVTTRVGGLIDLVGGKGNTTTEAIAGRLVPITEDEAIDSQGYADALLELATQTSVRQQTAHGAATLVRDIFDQDVTVRRPTGRPRWADCHSSLASSTNARSPCATGGSSPVWTTRPTRRPSSACSTSSSRTASAQTWPRSSTVSAPSSVSPARLASSRPSAAAMPGPAPSPIPSRAMAPSSSSMRWCVRLLRDRADASVPVRARAMWRVVHFRPAHAGEGRLELRRPLLLVPGAAQLGLPDSLARASKGRLSMWRARVGRACAMYRCRARLCVFQPG